MKHTLLGLIIVGACFSGSARAQVLVAADDQSHLSEVELAKVMAQDSSLWLSVRLAGRTRLALVTSASGVETSQSSDAWLRALDRATRVQVSPPPDPLAACANQTAFPAADSGLPEAATLLAEPVTSADSELTLRRSLENAGIPADLGQLDAFCAQAVAPFQIAWFDAAEAGGMTSAVRLIDHGQPSVLPNIRVASLGSSSIPIPFTFIGLADDSVLPDRALTPDPSELAITYFAASGTTDYAKARREFALEDANRWLLEAAGLAILPEAQAGGADGRLALVELGGQPLRATRWLGSLRSDASDVPSFHVATAARQEPHAVATDFDTSDCAPISVGQPATDSPGRAAPVDPPATVANGSSAAADPSSESTYASNGDGSCNAVVVGSSSDDSCTGDPSAPDPAPTESCSGDSSSSDTSSGDSCSGDSSSGDSSSGDSCSGDSKSSKSDDGYDGDTCSGDTSNSATNKSSAALTGGAAGARQKPRKVRLSLLTLLAAALSLPLRRRVK